VAAGKLRFSEGIGGPPKMVSVSLLEKIENGFDRLLTKTVFLDDCRSPSLWNSMAYTTILQILHRMP
jgi:hypothetical protein